MRDAVIEKQDLLAVDDLTISFGEPVVKGLSLRLAPGEVLALVGESGSGKTITCLALLGLLPPTARRSGSIHLSGRFVSNLSEEAFTTHRGRLTSIVFQDPRKHLDPSMRIGAQIEEVLRLVGGIPAGRTRERCLELLESVGLEAERVAVSFPHELSGGMCQRASIALAISCDPALLIADEPTTALDASVQRSILDLLLDIVGSRGMGMIFVTHDLRAVDYVPDTVAVMLGGHIVEQGPRDAVLSAPLHPYTRLLIDSIPDEHFLFRPRSATERPPIPGGCPFLGRCQYTLAECSASVPMLRKLGDQKVRCIRSEAFVGATA